MQKLNYIHSYLLPCYCTQAKRLELIPKIKVYLATERSQMIPSIERRHSIGEHDNTTHVKTINHCRNCSISPPFEISI